MMDIKIFTNGGVLEFAVGGGEMFFWQSNYIISSMK